MLHSRGMVSMPLDNAWASGTISLLQVRRGACWYTRNSSNMIKNKGDVSCLYKAKNMRIFAQDMED